MPTANPAARDSTATSGTGTSIAEVSRARGFTLLELLVVVVIIGLGTAGALLAFRGQAGDGGLARETDRLATLVSYVREQAELSAREFGLRCREDGYSFVVFDPRRGIWREVEEDEILRDRDLPEGLRLALRVEDRPVVLRAPPKEGDPKPQIMLFSNGDVTPFEVTLTREGAAPRGIVRSAETGDVERVPPDEGARS